MKNLVSLSFLAAFGLLLVSGCGGGGGGGGSTSTPVTPKQATPSISVAWPARTRDLGGPSSALSVKIVLHSPTSANPDIEIDGNRASSLAAVSQTYSYISTGAVGAYTLTASFYSQASLAGIITGTATASVSLSASGALTNPDGSALGTIKFSGAVSSVAIPSGQTVAPGSTLQVAASAADANKNPLVLSAGSYKFAVTSGGAFATITPDGILTGVAIGNAMVTATVDGVTSPAATISVFSPPDFANPGFEDPQIPTGAWYANLATQYQWSGDFILNQNTWGIANGSGSWGSGAHSGTQYAFIQHGANLNQTVNGLTVGKSYQVTFWCSCRSGDVGGNSPAPISVLANGTTIVPQFSPDGDLQWAQYTSASFTATASSYKFVFQTQANGVDSSDLIDDVHLVQLN